MFQEKVTLTAHSTFKMRKQAGVWNTERVARVGWLACRGFPMHPTERSSGGRRGFTNGLALFKHV